jgi:hypothetical protein
MQSIKLRFFPGRLLFASLAFAGVRLPAASSIDADSPPASSRADSRPGSATSQQLFQLRVGAPAARQALLLAIDERAFPFRDNLALFITRPAVRAEPVLLPSTSPDAPDNVGVACYGTVLHEAGRFRLWYYAIYDAAPHGGVNAGPVCYAESADGEHWVRPNLGQVEWHGSRHNNAIALGDKPEGFCSGTYVIRDEEDPRPERQYKMVYYYNGERPRHPGSTPNRIGTAVSPDGIHWTPLASNPTGDKFAELGSFYKFGGLYIISSHIFGRGADDRPEGRQGYAWVSTDFDHWLTESAPQFKTPEPVVGFGYGSHDDAGKGWGNYTQDHVGVGGAPFGNVVVAVWGMWHQRPGNWGEGGTNGDLGLVVSEDGLHFYEVVKGQPFIRSVDSPANPVPGRHYPTILVQGNGILDVGNETLIYHTRWRNVAFQNLATAKNGGINYAKDYWCGIGLARFPRDRWGALALSGKNETGSAWTAPVTLAEDCHLTVNGSGLAGLQVDVADERFRQWAGYKQGRTGGTANDEFDAEIGWTEHRLRELAGKTVRFHLYFSRSATTDPRLFALNLIRQP